MYFQRIIRAKEASDSIGGTVTCVIRNVPSGLGEPVFDKIEAVLAHAMLSIPATKGFEIGSGFKGTEVPGSKHNDLFLKNENGGLTTKTNWSGGIQGGITNGADIYFRCVLHILRREGILPKHALGLQCRFQVTGDDLSSPSYCAVRWNGGDTCSARAS